MADLADKKTAIAKRIEMLKADQERVAHKLQQALEDQKRVEAKEQPEGRVQAP